MPQNSIKAVTVSSFNAANLNNSFQAINASGLPNACFMIRIVNDSNASITISYDGSTSNDQVRANTDFIPELAARSSLQMNLGNWAQGTTVYVKGTAGAGTIYLAGYFVLPS